MRRAMSRARSLLVTHHFIRGVGRAVGHDDGRCFITIAQVNPDGEPLTPHHLRIGLAKRLARSFTRSARREGFGRWPLIARAQHTSQISARLAHITNRNWPPLELV